MWGGTNPLISYPCTLSLLRQLLLLNKSTNYLARKKELVYLCVPQDGRIQASAPVSFYVPYLKNGSSIHSEGSNLGCCRQTGKSDLSLSHAGWTLLPLHYCIKKHSSPCQLAVKGTKSQGCSALEGEMLASELGGSSGMHLLNSLSPQCGFFWNTSKDH